MLQVASSTINTKSKPKIEELASNREIKTRLLKMGRKRKFKKRLHEEIDIPPRKALPIDETEHSLCILLWQSTIVQALYDLANESSGAEAKLTKAEAANWFFVTPQSSDFELVCELACLSPAKVLKMARKVAKQGEKARKALISVLSGVIFQIGCQQKEPERSRSEYEFYYQKRQADNWQNSKFKGDRRREAKQQGSSYQQAKTEDRT